MQSTGTIRYLFRTTAATKLTVNKLLHSLTVNFSPDGSSRRSREEKTYNEFVKYLRDVYGKHSLLICFFFQARSIKGVGGGV